MYRARDEGLQYERMYGIKMPGKLMADRVAMVAHMNTMYANNRPIGTSFILGSWDMMTGYSLYMVEPSGTCYQYYGCSSGRGKQLARNELEKRNFREMTCEEALPHVTKM